MDNELQALCQQIFDHATSQITMHLRFMDIALNNYIHVANNATTIECDGTYLYYEPLYVIKTFKNNPSYITHTYLHIVLHSIFRHQFLSFDVVFKYWDLACDIAVENVIYELDLDSIKVPQTEDINHELEKLRNELPILSAQKIYRYLQDLEEDKVKLLAQVFCFDDHDKWHKTRLIRGSQTTLRGEESKDDPNNAGRNQFDGASHDAPDSEHHGEYEDTNYEDLSEKDKQEILKRMKQWQEISERIETDLETYNKQYGLQSPSLIQTLTRLNREKYDYSAFLKKFMSFGEKMMVNDDEFDYVYYTYGLQLYKNMPLIEALEYKETKSLKEIVIAIDTSGSVQGDKVQAFLQKTYNIFHQRDQFFNKFNIYILQCDMKIQHVAKMTSLEEFDDYIKNIKIYGLGGTDFRPVFDYIEELRNKKEITQLEGLLYFSDGDGAYPKKQPDYSTAFIFLDKNDGKKVPVWAIKYVLDEDEIMMEEQR